jgi:flagellin-like protein
MPYTLSCPTWGREKVFETMAFTKKNEEAVSPVIGVILMVAVTVILAAVIAAFVFGMAGNLQKGKSVAATAQHQGNKIYVTYQGGPDAAKVSSYNVTINEPTTGPQLVLAPGSVGNSTSFAANTGNNNHVVVTMNFDDGTSQVVLDTYV